jgi:putative DNA primase/helicase
LPFNPAGIPESLMGCPFVCVRDEWKEDLNKGKGGWVKVPKNPITGGNASPSDSSTGSDFTKALNALLNRSCNYDGVGILRTPGRLFVDMDGVLDPETGEIDPSSPVAEMARELLRIAVACGAYIERSPGGRGIHIIFRFFGELPNRTKRGCIKKGQGREHCEVALYDHNRYFDLTGITMRGSGPATKDATEAILAFYDKWFPAAATAGKSEADHSNFSLHLGDNEVLEKALRAKNGDKVRSLLVMGDITGYPSGSEADYAAVGLLKFWTQDPTQIEGIILNSALHRDKHERPDYLPRTIAKVLAAGGETYDPFRSIRNSVFQPRPERQPEQPGQPEEPEPSPQEPPDLLKQDHTDGGNAERLIAYRGHGLRYCYATQRWLCWDGQRWRDDVTEHARMLAVETALEFIRQCIAAKQDDEFAVTSRNSSRITNMLREAQPALAVTPDQLDQHPYLLNFLNGTVDLRTGELNPHRRENLITKLVRFDYDPEAGCVLFLKTLTQLMGGDVDPERAERLLSYLQRAFGYSLTGVTDAKATFIAHGSGNNGKTTLLSLFATLIEEYSAILDINTLMTRVESNNTQADLADLRGARFVRTSETEEGQRLAEGKLKRITQGMGKIKACRKYENPIEFPETHKLWMDANHKPEIKGGDDAIWNRLHLVPFDVTIPKEKIDRTVPEKLLAEATGILAWAVKGAKLWLEHGLAKPPEVEAAASEYREEMDQVKHFIDECCVVEPGAKVGARALHNTYRKWAEDAGERWLSETAFGVRMAKRGFQKSRTNSGMVYCGIGVRSA